MKKRRKVNPFLLKRLEERVVLSASAGCPSYIEENQEERLEESINQAGDKKNEWPCLSLFSLNCINRSRNKIVAPLLRQALKKEE